jgi:hypothetical protein
LPATADTAHRVAVINQTLAHSLWPNQGAVSRQLAIGPERRTVIGVVGDFRTQRLDEAADGQMHLSMAELSQPYASIVARGLANPR